MAKHVPYSLEAIHFIISMKLKNPAQLVAFVYLVSHPKADFSHPCHFRFNLLYILAKIGDSKFWNLFCKDAITMPPLRMGDRFVIDWKRLTPVMHKSLSKRISIIDNLAVT